jgi:hypothetical protein
MPGLSDGGEQARGIWDQMFLNASWEHEVKWTPDTEIIRQRRKEQEICVPDSAQKRFHPAFVLCDHDKRNGGKCFRILKGTDIENEKNLAGKDDVDLTRTLRVEETDFRKGANVKWKVRASLFHTIMSPDRTRFIGLEGRRICNFKLCLNESKLSDLRKLKEETCLQKTY